MKYEALSEDLRSRLEAAKKAIARHSAQLGEEGKVNDAILLDQSSDLHISGYDSSTVATWFEFASESLSDDDSVRLAEEALIINV